jgi:hypothetical protein
MTRPAHLRPSVEVSQIPAAWARADPLFAKIAICSMPPP